MDRLPIVVYDANVLYPAFLRDVLLRIAAADLVEAHWTARIHDEWTHNLLRDRSDLTPDQVVRTRGMMDHAFPSALVTDCEALLTEIELPDPDDCHVVAAARHAEATYIVTHNLQDFPVEILRQFGIEPLSPDALLVRLLDADFETTVRTLERHRSLLARPPMTPAEYLSALVKAGLVGMVRRLSDAARTQGGL